MTLLTKTDVAAFRAADTLCVHLHKDKPAGLVRLIKRIPKSDENPFGPFDREHVLSADVAMTEYGWKEHVEAGRVKCFAHVSFYHEQHTSASNIIRQLRVGDEVTFEFRPDSHSNGYLARFGLHADVLVMKVRRSGITYTWELDSSVTPENSARMCAGWPSSQRYLDSAKEVA